MDELCRDLAAAGWAAWNLEYRRLGGGGGWPATLLDVAAGIDALADLTARGASLDLRTVVAIGHSAGGHLALWAAARRVLAADEPGAHPRVAVTHAVGQAAVSDLAEAVRLRLGRGAASELLGSPGREPPLDQVIAASPAARLPLGVPQLLVHGGRDDAVPVTMGRAYAELARAAGDDVELVVDDQAGHYEHLEPRSAVWQAVRSWLPSPS